MLTCFDLDTYLSYISPSAEVLLVGSEAPFVGGNWFPSSSMQDMICCGFFIVRGVSL